MAAPDGMSEARAERSPVDDALSDAHVGVYGAVVRHDRPPGRCGGVARLCPAYAQAIDMADMDGYA
jgi:hypothetical protein